MWSWKDCNTIQRKKFCTVEWLCWNYFKSVHYDSMPQGFVFETLFTCIIWSALKIPNSGNDPEKRDWSLSGKLPASIKLETPCSWCNFSTWDYSTRLKTGGWYWIHLRASHTGSQNWETRMSWDWKNKNSNCLEKSRTNDIMPSRRLHIFQKIRKKWDTLLENRLYLQVRKSIKGTHDRVDLSS